MMNMSLDVAIQHVSEVVIVRIIIVVKTIVRSSEGF